MEDRSNRRFFDYESSEADGDAPLPPSFSTTLRHSVAETGLVDILETCIQYNVTTYFFPSTPAASGTWTPTSALGAGLTCVVRRYEAQEDIRPDLKQGTAVAIKQYLLHRGTGDPKVVSEGTIFNLIKRDVEIMASPRFKDEENIARLLFVGYTEDSPFPTLGVELALHGTLDYVLRSPGDGLADSDKINITIDIGTGLDALHDAGIAHGDLKCENILVCHHETRGVVAKITDFSGSCHVGREDARPSHFTTLWSPPEELLQGTSIDWQKADVYAYGLLVASIWMRTSEVRAYELSPSFSTCGMEELVPSETISEEEKEDERERLKLKVDHAENSLVSLLSKALSERMTSTLAPVVISILKASLATCPWDRSTIREIIDEHLAGFQIEPRQETEDRRKDRNSEAGSMTDVPESNVNYAYEFWHIYGNAPVYWRNIIYALLAGKATPLLGLVGEELGDIDELQESEAFHARIQGLVQGLTGHQDAPVLSALSRHATLAGLAKMWERGNDTDSSEGLKWLQLAAICEIACGGEDSFATRLVVAFLGNSSERLATSSHWENLPVKFWLTWLTIDGSEAARRKLKQQSPTLEAKVSELFRAEFLELAQMPQEDLNNSMPYLRHIVKTYQVDEIQKFIHSYRDRVSDFTHEGTNVLHWLASLDGPLAPELSGTFFELGARLDLIGPAGGTGSSGILALPFDCSPLCTAVFYGTPRVFDKLIELHLQHQVSITDFKQTLEMAILLNYAAMVESLLQARSSHPDLCGPSPAALDSTAEDVGVSLVLSPDLMGPLLRVAAHGTETLKQRESTILVLGRLRAKLVPAINSTIDRDQPSDLQLTLTIRTWKDEDIHTMLKYCIRKNAKRCFGHLLSRHPHLAAVRLPPVYLSLFCYAAQFSHGDYFLGELYEATPEVLEVNGPLWLLPLSFALLNGQLSCAKFIFEHRTQASDGIDKLLQVDEQLERKPADTLLHILHVAVKNWCMTRSQSTLPLVRWIVENTVDDPLYLVRRNLRLPFELSVRRREPPQNSNVTARMRHVEEDVVFWHELLDRPLLGPAVDFRSAEAMMALFFNKFPQSCEHVDGRGWAPLHCAAWNGSVAAVQLLLNMGVDINRQVQPGHEAARPLFENLVGRTPLNLAIYALYAKAPPAVIQGGIIEVRQWRARQNYIIELLARHGARSGLQVTTQEMAFALRFTRRLRLLLSGMTPAFNDYSDALFFGKWPERLPNRPKVDLSGAFGVASHSGRATFMNVMGEDFLSEAYNFYTPKRWRDVYTLEEINAWTAYSEQYNNTTGNLKASKRTLPEDWDVRINEAGVVLYGKRTLLVLGSPMSPRRGSVKWQTEKPMSDGRVEVTTTTSSHDLAGRLQRLQVNARTPGTPLLRGRHMGPDSMTPTVTTFCTHGDLEDAIDNQPLNGRNLLESIERSMGISGNNSWLS